MIAAITSRGWDDYGFIPNEKLNELGISRNQFWVLVLSPMQNEKCKMQIDIESRRGPCPIIFIYQFAL